MRSKARRRLFHARDAARSGCGRRQDRERRLQHAGLDHGLLAGFEHDFGRRRDGRGGRGRHGDAALGHENGDALRIEADVEGGADVADGERASMDVEGRSGGFRDGKVSFAGAETDAAHRSGSGVGNGGTAVQDGNRPVRQSDAGFRIGGSGEGLD
ncbi:MAG: hypothetical protein QM736_06240 [Vicinamibacterales bacterium]